MRRKGFTLAEVLITLSIIGVVAALTMPAVTKSYEKATYIASYKKTYSTLSQVANMLKVDYGSIEAATNGKDSALFYPVWTQYVKIAKTCKGSESYYNTDCWRANNNWYNLDGVAQSASIGHGVLTPDGMVISYFMSSSNCSMPEGSFTDICGTFWVDINGKKGPDRWGKDIHNFHLTRKGIFPRFNSSGGPFDNCKEGSDLAPNGVSCGHEIMMGTYDWEN